MKKIEAGNNTGSRPPISAIEAIFEGIALAAFFMTIWFPVEAWPHLPQNTVSPVALGGKGNLLFLPILNTFLYLA
ncbi:MAG: hypothetical protein HGB11_11555, partial [Chlorobiales bacterium]|nr:hypothetical protein [Chlorobiales bacterium]